MIIKKENLGIKGFTLIEVLVAVGVLAVATLAFLPSFSKSFEGKKLQTAAAVVRDAMATARNRALTQTGIAGQDESVSYKYSGVRVTAGASNILLFRSKAADVDTCTKQLYVEDSKINFPEGIQARIDTTFSPTCIFFTYKTGDCLTTKGNNPANVFPCTN